MKAGNKHSVEVSKNDLPLQEHLTWHERGWVAQRIGWVLLFSITLAGALGLFGDGYLSDKKITAGNTSAEFEKFGRYQKEMEIVIKSPASHIANISLPKTYLEHFSEIKLIPEPKSQETRSGNVIYTFEGIGNRQVSLYAMPHTTGSFNGLLQVNNHQFSLHHFIYP